MIGFDKHLHEVLRDNPGLAKDYAALIAELPVTTQLGIMRRRQALSQETTGRRMKKPQSVVARLESSRSDPRLSTVEQAAKALGCRLMIVPSGKLAAAAKFCWR